MRFIAAAAAVALLATCSVVNANFDISPIVGQANALLGSLVGLENSLIAPITPLGRKLQQFPGSDSSLVKANALGSIFYAPGGLYNPALYGAAITGVQPSGRKLQTFLPGSGGVGPDGLPDPYGFIPAANLVASVLKGKFPGRKLQSADEEELKWDAESVHSALGFSRKLQQDQVAANTLGSIVYGGIQTIDTAKGLFGRKLQQTFDPTRTGYLGTGSKAVQNNAVLSIAGNPALLDDPLTIRQATLGFQQTEGRHLLSEQVKVDAAGSLISGNITPDNVRKAILGFNQGSQNRHLLSEQVKVDAAGSLISGNITPDNVRKAILGFNQGSQNRHLLSEQVKVDAAGSLISGNITPDNVRKAILGFNQGSQNRHLLSEQVKVDAAGSLISGNITPDNVRKAILGFNQGSQNRHL